MNTPRPRPQRGIKASMRRKRRSRAVWIVVGLVGVGAVALLTVVAASGGTKNTGAVTLVQIQPVKTSGTRLATYTPGAADPAVGTPAPRLDGKTFGSNPISVKPGRATMLVFIAHPNADSTTEVPNLVLWHHAGSAPGALDVVGVVTGPGRDNPKVPPSSWLVDNEWPWPVLVDDSSFTASTTYGFTTYPAFALIGTDGLVKYRGTGVISAVELAKLIRTNLGV